MTNEEYLDYISVHLTARDLLEQLAEEASELGQAAMKTCRTLEESNNPTDCDEADAWEHVDEEMVDVLNAYCAVCASFVDGLNAFLDCHSSPKWERWYQRVKEKQEAQG